MRCGSDHVVSLAYVCTYVPLIPPFVPGDAMSVLEIVVVEGIVEVGVGVGVRVEGCTVAGEDNTELEL